MEFVDFGRYAGGLLVTLGLLALALVLLRRFGPTAGGASPQLAERRIAIAESRMIDAKRRLVVVRYAEKEHLILLGAAGEQLIASAVPTADASAPSPVQNEAA